MSKVRAPLSSAPSGHPRAPSAGAKSVEETYRKLDQVEHILLRPDTYIGSIQRVTQPMWLLDAPTRRIVSRTASFVPGLYKIFDEILVNAADNKQRDAGMALLRVEIDAVWLAVGLEQWPRRARAGAPRPRRLRARAHFRPPADFV